MTTLTPEQRQEIRANNQGRSWQISALLDALDAAEAREAKARAEKGEALELLGLAGAGGAPAGLVPAIHNLIGMAEKIAAREAALRAMVDEHAEDGGLWFVPRTAPEAYLQAELRRLHALIEQDDLTLRLLGQP